MKGSLIVVGFFALGCLLGWSGYLPGVIIENDITVYVLYLLMFQVGISIGSDKKLKEILSSIRPKLLLVPLATIIGTLSFSALISLALTKWSVFDCLAVGSGFAYYSLSSILITELKEPTLGAQLAAELGTIALRYSPCWALRCSLDISEGYLRSAREELLRWIRHCRSSPVIAERIWSLSLSFTGSWWTSRFRFSFLSSVRCE